MNKRIAKKVEKRRRDKIHELLDLTLDINSTMPRWRQETGEQSTAFLNFMGHIGVASIQIYMEGWETGSSPSKDMWVHTYSVKELSQALSQMEQLKHQICATK